jgi:hypothetical protein
VATALAVVIPEGFHAFAGHTEGHVHAQNQPLLGGGEHRDDHGESQHLKSRLSYGYADTLIALKWMNLVLGASIPSPGHAEGHVHAQKPLLGGGEHHDDHGES